MESGKEQGHILESWLFIPEEQIIKFAEQLAAALEKYPWFISVSPHGSRMKGFHRKSSDMDFVILYDSSKTAGADHEAIISECVNSVNVEKRKIGLMDYDLSAERVRSYTSNLAHQWDLSGFGHLCGEARGTKVVQFRESIGQHIRAMPKEDSELFVNMIVHQMVNGEREREPKIEKRFGAPENRGDFWQARRDLWRKNIKEKFHTEN